MCSMNSHERYTRVTYRCANGWPWSVFTLLLASLLYARLRVTYDRTFAVYSWDKYSLCVTRATSIAYRCSYSASQFARSISLWNTTRVIIRFLLLIIYRRINFRTKIYFFFSSHRCTKNVEKTCLLYLLVINFSARSQNENSRWDRHNGSLKSFRTQRRRPASPTRPDTWMRVSKC